MRSTGSINFWNSFQSKEIQRTLVAVLKSGFFQEKKKGKFSSYKIQNPTCFMVYFIVNLKITLQHCYFFWKRLRSSFLSRVHVLALLTQCQSMANMNITLSGSGSPKPQQSMTTYLWCHSLDVITQDLRIQDIIQYTFSTENYRSERADTNYTAYIKS